MATKKKAKKKQPRKSTKNRRSGATALGNQWASAGKLPWRPCYFGLNFRELSLVRQRCYNASTILPHAAKSMPPKNKRITRSTRGQEAAVAQKIVAEKKVRRKTS